MCVYMDGGGNGEQPFPTGWRVNQRTWCYTGDIYIQIYGWLICCTKLNAIKLHSGIKNAINNPQV